MRLWARVFVVLIMCATATPAAASPTLQATPQPTPQERLPRGMVIALVDTPHLWIADDQGVLHWGGDTRALAGKFVDWGNRWDVELSVLLLLPRGDPWLSAGLLKIGDPIYLAKWETDEQVPRLLHIQSVADVELFGIDGGNYGRFVLDQTAWERQHNLAAGPLVRAPLPAAVASPTPPATSPTPPTSTPAPGSPGMG